MKNILFVGNGLGNGGAERVISLLANALINEGENVYILSFVKADKTYNINPHVNIISASNGKNSIDKKIRRIIMIRRVAKEQSIDVVIAFSYYYVMAAILALAGTGIKLIGSERNDPAQLDNRTILKIFRNMLYKRLDVLVCQTEDAKKYFPLKIQDKIIIIMNPVTECLPEAYFGKRDNRIVSFSRLEPQKNIPMIIDAFAMLHNEYPELILELYGEGSQKSEIINYIKERKLDNFAFVRPFAIDIHEKIKKAAMFVLASNYEGLSNAMLEAMAIGLPTICTDCPCGGARMAIQDNINGFLIQVGDTVALYRKMKFIVENKEKARNIAMKATTIRNSLNSKHIIAKWREVI
ncbi:MULTISPECIES: glycosyltransferase [Clostridia]|uniref:glycosyltransferase n=1 Tax=Clostridia TaxID=186801 RepID=UPI00067E98D9|nr:MULTISPECIES: glycosyltransferase [Clostridia]